MQLGPNPPTTHNIWRNFPCNMGRPTQAVRRPSGRSTGSALSAAHSDSVGHSSSGTLLRILVACERALELAPDMHPLLYVKHSRCIELGKYAERGGDVRALSQGIADVSLARGGARCSRLARNGDVAEATGRTGRSCREQPEIPTSSSALAWAHAFRRTDPGSMRWSE